MNFSVALIARNEAKTLPRLLSSLVEFKQRGGEVIVVDTGSTDDTAKIALDWGCIVEQVGDRFRREITEKEAKGIYRKFSEEDEEVIVKVGDSLFDFTSARNYAASLASNDFVWMPDADECFTKFDLDAIQTAVSQTDRLEYEFIFSHDPEGNPAIRFLHSKAYNRKKFHWQGIVHEVLAGEGRTTYLPQDKVLLELFQNQETVRTGYLKGLALDCYLNPDNDRNSHYLGRELLWTGRIKSAIKELKRHVAMDKWQPERSQSMVFIGDAYARLGQHHDAITAYQEAYNIEPGRREPLIKLAETYMGKRDAQRAATYAAASLQIPQGSFYADFSEHYRHVPHQILAEALFHLGRKEESKIHLEKCLEYQPTAPNHLFNARFFYDLPKVSILLPTLGRPEGLERAKASIEAQNYPKELIEVLIDDREEPTVPEKVRDMNAQATGDYALFMANDAELDSLAVIQAVLMALKTGKRFVALDSGREDEAEHFLIHRGFVKQLEDQLIFSTDMVHVGVDNWLTAQCQMLGEFIRCKLAKVTHHHFTRGAEFDAVYERGWKNVEKDRATLAAKLALLA